MNQSVNKSVSQSVSQTINVTVCRFCSISVEWDTRGFTPCRVSHDPFLFFPSLFFSFLSHVGEHPRQSALVRAITHLSFCSCPYNGIRLPHYSSNGQCKGGEGRGGKGRKVEEWRGKERSESCGFEVWNQSTDRVR